MAEMLEDGRSNARETIPYLTAPSNSGKNSICLGCFFKQCRKQPRTEIQLLFGTLRSTQKQIQKAGTAQGLFVEDMKDKFGFGGGKPTNVRKGNVRKKD